MATGWKIRPIRMPDEHLPIGPRETDWRCRTCATPWPCETAGEHLTMLRCTCGAPTYHETRGPRRWHKGPRCYTATDAVLQQAADLKAYREAHPHYPPSHYYPPKPRRARRQKPPYRHRPAAPGDIRPGTWTWVKPGALLRIRGPWVVHYEAHRNLLGMELAYRDMTELRVAVAAAMG